MLISKEVELKGGRKNDKILDTTFKGFIGALIKDNKSDLASDLIISIIEEELDFTNLIINDKNYKDILLRYYQKNHWNFPEYELEKMEGPSYDRIFFVSVYGERGQKGEVKVGFGQGKTKKEAEQNASKEALIYYEQYKDSADVLDYL